MLFSKVVGFSEVKKRLVHAIHEKKIPHAQMFLGKEGSGNLPMAFSFVQFLFCDNRQEFDSCGNCPSCLKVEKLIHPDLHLVFPITLSKETRVSGDLIKDFRECFLHNPYMSQQDWFNELNAENKQAIISKDESVEIIKKLSYTSFEGKGKVLIIWQPEKMNNDAANKLLKILEEPPDETYFILVCHDTEKILPTILSRTQVIKFGSASNDEIVVGLNQYYGATESSCMEAAALSEGNFRNASKILAETDSNVQLLNQFQSFMRTCLKFDAFKLVEWIESIQQVGREKQKLFMQYALQVFRDCLMINSGAEKLVLLRGEELVFIKKFSPFVNLKNYERLTEEYNKSYFHLERNANPKILFMDLALKTNEYLNIKSGA